jgi:hypothetical protein
VGSITNTSGEQREPITNKWKAHPQLLCGERDRVVERTIDSLPVRMVLRQRLTRVLA